MTIAASFIICVGVLCVAIPLMYQYAPGRLCPGSWWTSKCRFSSLGIFIIGKLIGHLRDIIFWPFSLFPQGQMCHKLFCLDDVREHCQCAAWMTEVAIYVATCFHSASTRTLAPTPMGRNSRSLGPEFTWAPVKDSSWVRTCIPLSRGNARPGSFNFIKYETCGFPWYSLVIWSG